MKLTEEQRKFCRDLMIKEARYIQTGARVPIDDYMKIRVWSSSNNFPVSWIIKRGVKDFIKNYVETGILPSGEIVDRGNAGKGRPKKEEEYI